MNDLQANEIIDKTLNSHWPTWTFPPEETKVWVRELRKYDYIRAKSAIDNFYMAQTKQGKPAPGAIRAALRANALENRDQQQGKRTGPLFGICRADGRLRWRKFSGDLNMPRQEVENMAGKFCRYANQLEAGHYYVLYSTDEETAGYTGEEGCTVTQRRQKARDKAFRDILSGPDTKTKLWLQKYLNRDKSARKEISGPVHISETIAEKIPF